MNVHVHPCYFKRDLQVGRTTGGQGTTELKFEDSFSGRWNSPLILARDSA